MNDCSETQGLWDDELATTTASNLDWIWQGFIARGNLTLLTGLWKSGKTTLLSMLLARRKPAGEHSEPAGSPTTCNLAGLPVTPGKTIVISEERRELWAARTKRHGFGRQVYFFTRPFRGAPSIEQWQRFIDRIAALHDEHGFDLLVIDPLAPLLHGENNARNMLDVLTPLAALTNRDMAVLVLHHPARGNPPIGHAARGSGALLAHVDIAIEMRHLAHVAQVGSDPNTRRRQFFALSRHDETPRLLTLELNADTSDYVTVTEAITHDGFDVAWPVLSMIFDDARQKLSRIEILDEWPADFDKPSPTALRGYLDHAVKHSLLACEGSGRKSDPFVYWFPKNEEKWKQDPFYEVFEMQRRVTRETMQSLTGARIPQSLARPTIELAADEPDL